VAATDPYIDPLPGRRLITTKQTTIITAYPLGRGYEQGTVRYTVAAVLPGGTTLIHRTANLPTLKRAQHMALRIQKRGWINRKEWR